MPESEIRDLLVDIRTRVGHIEESIKDFITKDTLRLTVDPVRERVDLVFRAMLWVVGLISLGFIGAMLGMVIRK